MTRNGAASGRVWPSIVTCRSAIASSSADCVLGGARLISSASSRLVKTGPGRNSNSALSARKTDEPVTSLGIRSGVNWMRPNSMSSTWANDRATSVLARPG